MTDKLIVTRLNTEIRFEARDTEVTVSVSRGSDGWNVSAVDPEGSDLAEAVQWLVEQGLVENKLEDRVFKKLKGAGSFISESGGGGLVATDKLMQVVRNLVLDAS